MLCIVAPLTACTEPVVRTQVVVVIDAEESLRARIRYVDVEVRSGSDDEEAWDLVFATTLMPRRPGEGWPLDFRMPQPERGQQNGYLVAAVARSADDTPLTTVRVLSEYKEGRTLLLTLRFDEACASRAVMCPKTFSCEAGKCVDLYVDPNDLPTAEEAPLDSAPPPPPRGEPMAGTGATPGCTGASCNTAGATCNGGDCAMPSCATRDDQGVCQRCPSGFIDAADGCRPGLTGLTLSAGELTPAFEPSTTEYDADVPLLAASVSLQLQAPEEVELLLNGAPVAAATELPTPLEIGDNPLTITLNAAGHASRTYRVNLHRTGTRLQQLTPATSSAGDALGCGLSMSGDRIVVGAPNEDGPDDRLADSGAAYVFERTATGWEERAMLKAEEPRAGAHFGQTSAIDGNRIAVSAPEDQDRAGAVYVFELEGDSWNRVATLRGKPRSLFGRGVSLAGDVLVVGAPSDSEGRDSSEAGSAFVYTRDPMMGWQQSAMLRPTNIKTWDWFGSSVSIVGDTIVVGATGRTVPGETLPSGAVWVYAREDTGWREVQMIWGDPVETSAFFGEALAFTGDELAISGFYGNVGLTGGTVYMFERGADGMFSQKQVLRPKNTRADDFFGSRLAFAGDTLIIGAANEDSAAPGIGAPGTGSLEKSGAVYLFQRGRSGWQEQLEIKSDDPLEEEEFGRTIATNGTEFVIGAPSDVPRDGKSPRSGTLYLYR